MFHNSMVHRPVFRENPQVLGFLASLWGMLGVSLLLLRAIVRLTPPAIAPWVGTISHFHATLAVVWLIFNAYVEGYRGFQKRFCPRVVSRALYLRNHPRWWSVAFAPAFCMGLIYASQRRLMFSWGFTFFIVGIVSVMKRVPQPWKGIIDGGVVIGLVWGVCVLWWLFARAIIKNETMEPQDLPKRNGVRAV